MIATTATVAVVVATTAIVAMIAAVSPIPFASSLLYCEHSPFCIKL